MRKIILALGLAAAAFPLTAVNAQWHDGYRDRGYHDGYRNREVRREMRECRRELRNADSRREYMHERRECRRELARARQSGRYAEWDRRWSRW